MLAALPGVAGAQGDERIPNRLFTPLDGLPGEDVTAIAQTPDGLLWVGTRQGLAYFDGFRFHEISFSDDAAAPWVSSLFPAHDGTLWITTASDGVWHLPSDRQPRKVDTLGDRMFTTVLTRGSTTFFLGYGSAWALDKASNQPRHLSYGYEIVARLLGRWAAAGVGTGPNDAIVAADGQIVILDRDLGPRLFDPDTGAVTSAEYRGTWSWLSIAMDSHGGLWALDDERGLFILDGDLVPRLVFASTGNQHLLIDRSTAYISTRNGLRRYDIATGRELDLIGPSLGVRASPANRSFVDDAGSYWIGTPTHLIYVPRPNVRNIEHVQGERLFEVSIGAPASNGELWAGTWGLVRLAPSLKLVQLSDVSQWYSVSSSTDGQLFAIGREGVARFADGQWRHTISMADAVRGGAGEGETIYVWKVDGVYQYSNTGGPAIPIYQWPSGQQNYHAIAPTPDGDVIVRARDLLLRAQVDHAGPAVRLDTLAVLEGFEESGSHQMAVDARGAVWIGFWDRGLARVQDGVTTIVLPGQSVAQLNVSGDSLLFVSTRSGLYALDLATEQMVFSVHQEDGLTSNSTGGAAIVGEDLFVSHDTGVSRLPLDAVTGRFPALPRVHIVPLGNPIGRSDDVATHSRDPAFRFFAAAYLNPSAIAYDYRLGREEWTPAEGNVVQFHRLGGGLHTLEVRARHRSSAPGPVASYAFIVPTPYFQSTWFRLLLVVALVLIGGLAFIARFKALGNRAKELKKLVEERTLRLAEAMHTTERQADLLRQHDELKTRFFTNVSHEFRTPLTLIRGLVSDVVQGRHGSLNGEVEARLCTVSENTERLTRLVEDLLELSKLEAGQALLHPAPGDLVASVKASARAHVPASERVGVCLSSRTDAEAYPAIFDSGAVDKIVSNLLSNAIKHTAPGGHIDLSLSVTEAAPRVTITVRDDGEGIAESLLPHIFDRFVLGEEEAGSSGIGLAMVKELVALHDGTIEVESETGRGSRFTVSLPIARQQVVQGDGFESNASPPAIAVARSPAPDLRRTEAAASDAAQVLIVDDNPDIRAYVASHLARHYHIREAADGAEALALARAARPALIVSDVMMPGMSGDEMCRQLRADEALADVPVILLTARAGGQGAIEGLHAGADAYVEKPFHMDALLARVKRLIMSREALKASYARRMVIDGLNVEIDSADEALLQQMFELVEARIGESTFGVEDLAVELGLSPRHLRRRIKEATGQSPVDILRRYRLERAARLLSAGGRGFLRSVIRSGMARPLRSVRSSKSTSACARPSTPPVRTTYRARRRSSGNRLAPRQ